MHGLFMDDMMHVPTCSKLHDEFLALNQKDFEITGGGLMETFLEMEVEQPDKMKKLHLDCFIQEVLTEYTEYSIAPLIKNDISNNVSIDLSAYPLKTNSRNHFVQSVFRCPLD
jgi:hypothetical protein